MKTCNKCGETKDFSEFHRNKGTKDGYASICITCTKERNEKLKESPLLQLEKAVKSSISIENKILFKEGKKLCSTCSNIYLITETRSGYCTKCYEDKNKKYYEKNREKAKEYNEKYYEENKKISNERAKEYYEKNREKIKEQGKNYREKNKEKNKEKMKDYMKEYRIKNKEKLNKQRRQGRLKLKEGI